MAALGGGGGDGGGGADAAAARRRQQKFSRGRHKFNVCRGQRDFLMSLRLFANSQSGSGGGGSPFQGVAT